MKHSKNAHQACTRCMGNIWIINGQLHFKPDSCTLYQAATSHANCTASCLNNSRCVGYWTRQLYQIRICIQQRLELHESVCQWTSTINTITTNNVIGTQISLPSHKTGKRHIIPNILLSYCWSHVVGCLGTNHRLWTKLTANSHHSLPFTQWHCHFNSIFLWHNH